jgi:hypothetical protein
MDMGQRTHRQSTDMERKWTPTYTGTTVTGPDVDTDMFIYSHSQSALAEHFPFCAHYPNFNLHTHKSTGLPLG